LTYPAIILAGGKSKRMGQNKVILEIEGRPLIIHVLEALKKAGCESFLIQIKSKNDFELISPLISDYNVKWGYDKSKKYDVLQALRLALITTKKFKWECVQLAPIDTPFVSPKLFQGLSKLLQNDLEAVIPSSNLSKNTPSSGYEPLLSCLKVEPTIKQIDLISKNKDKRLAKLFDNLNHVIVEPKQWLAWGVTENSFKNLNYPTDLE
jgi:molybdopterin-guanine dinucleotide biosynthesis protein A